MKIGTEVLFEGSFVPKGNLIRLVKKFSPTSKLIAERVETFFDFKTALREGFDLWQGYFEKELNDAPVINVNNL